MPNHLLGIEDMTRGEFDGLLDNALKLTEISSRDLKKVPALRGKTVISLFLEPTTRTKTSFDIAAKWLSADLVTVAGGDEALGDRESLLDIARTLESMAPDILVVRHPESGSARFLANYLARTSVVNAGDGFHEHPTQALVDCLTLKQALGTLEGLTVGIVGDARHSRVCRSTLFAHLLLGNRVRLVGPPSLVPDEAAELGGESGRLTIHRSVAEGIRGADVVVCLGLQKREATARFVPSLDEYARAYRITEPLLRLEAPNAVVLHPGPIARGLEISSEVADGPRSLVLKQVNNGAPARMAVLLALAVGRREEVAA